MDPGWKHPGKTFMIYSFLTNSVIVIHFLFIFFVVFGGFFVFKWKKIKWIHVPVFIYGTLIEWFGWICPLTYLEVWLLGKTDMTGYGSGFIDHYIVPLIYPENLTQCHHIILGVFVLVLNFLIYGWMIYRKRSRI